MRKTCGSVWTSSALLPVTALAVAASLGHLAGCAAGDGGSTTGPGSSGNAATPGATSPNPGLLQKPGASSPTTQGGGSTWSGSAPKGSVPVTGGTLLITTNGETAVAADPDRDLVSIVDLGSRSVLAQFQLPLGAEPGRLVEDGTGQVHVVLRRGGGIADIDVAGRKLLALRQVCALPRGIAYRASDSTLLVGCMTGALVTMDTNATKTAPIASTMLQTPEGAAVSDLRDVLVSGDSVFVTTFRSAHILKVGSAGLVDGPTITLNTRVDPSSAQLAEAGISGGTPQNYVPEVAWRSVVGPAGDIIVVHEGGTDRLIDTTAADNGGTQTPISTSCTAGGAYSGEVCTTTTGAPICVPPILIAAVSSVSPSGVVSDGPALPNGALPVDIVASADGKSYFVALAGNPGGAVGADGSRLLNVLTVPSVSVAEGPEGNAATFDSDLCGTKFAESGVSVPGQVTAMSVDPAGVLLVQTREPAALQYLTTAGIVTISLSSTSVANVGFDLFHTNTGRGMTCAGCHAEGQDDGRTWLFTNSVDPSTGAPITQARRTQTFREGFLETAPFHWDGQFSDIPALMQDVFLHRMAAPVAPTDAQQTAIEQWMNGIPAKMHDAPSSALAGSIAAGKTVFEDATVGCTSCHSGKNFTNNQSADIGFGTQLQVPTLIDVSYRAPFLHDGSVETLADRFTDPTAMSGKHGTTAQLSPTQIGDLVAYLTSL